MNKTTIEYERIKYVLEMINGGETIVRTINIYTQCCTKFGAGFDRNIVLKVNYFSCYKAQNASGFKCNKKLL